LRCIDLEGGGQKEISLTEKGWQNNRMSAAFSSSESGIGKEKGRNSVEERNYSENKQGRLATFIVHIQYRQNATWQGRIVWTEENQASHFRSALEMLKLIDSAVEQADAEGQDDCCKEMR
jgi:hypothetical protein